MYDSNDEPINSAISQMLASYGNYMEIVNIWASNRPDLYSKAFASNAISFLSFTQYQILRKKHEQEYINRASQKN